MLRLLLLLFSITSLLTTAAAQQLGVAPQKVYLDSLFTVLPSAVGAQYYRQTVLTDSVAGEVKDYYLSGQLQSSGTFDDVLKLVPNGTLQTWRASGELESRATYSHAVLGEAQARFKLKVINVTAPPAVLAARLAGRGRESAGEINARLARSAPVPPSID
ncbi:MAG: hypothetical protein EOO85_13195, partial [Pedobacter sp.]